jgi:hypothetical protein
MIAPPRLPGAAAIRIAAALALSASACALLRGPPTPMSAAEAAAAGCYVSPGGWWLFGDPSRADTAVRGWVVLHPRPTRYPGSYVAEFTGVSFPSTRDESPHMKSASWGMRGDSLWIGWFDGFSGMGIRAVFVDGELRGRGHLSTDILKDSAGVLVPEEFDWEVRAPRVPCEQVPEIPSGR